MADPVSFVEDYLDPSSVQHVLHFETLGLELVRLLRAYGISFKGMPRKNVATWAAPAAAMVFGDDSLKT